MVCVFGKRQQVSRSAPAGQRQQVSRSAPAGQRQQVSRSAPAGQQVSASRSAGQRQQVSRSAGQRQQVSRSAPAGQQMRKNKAETRERKKAPREDGKTRNPWRLLSRRDCAPVTLFWSLPHEMSGKCLAKGTLRSVVREYWLRGVWTNEPSGNL
jgi:hypothetical protein